MPNAVEVLKELYLAVADMVSSEPDMPTHAETERVFENTMVSARRVLEENGVTVPPLD